jgi:hypothetical protein
MAMLIAEHTSISIEWDGASSERSEAFDVLGNWQNTQYNIPSQSTCSGGNETVSLFNSIVSQGVVYEAAGLIR